MTLVPIAARAGLASSKSAAAPPTMIASVPSVARGVPPETGASMKRTPRSCAAFATRCDIAGSMVDMSTHRVPLRAAASTPPSPVYTDSTCGEEGSIVTTMSAVATASAALAAAVMPAAAGGLHRLGIAIESGHGEALLHEVLRHGQPHGAHADEADTRHALPPWDRSETPVHSSMIRAIAVWSCSAMPRAIASR